MASLRLSVSAVDMVMARDGSLAAAAAATFLFDRWPKCPQLTMSVPQPLASALTAAADGDGHLPPAAAADSSSSQHVDAAAMFPLSSVDVLDNDMVNDDDDCIDCLHLSTSSRDLTSSAAGDVVSQSPPDHSRADRALPTPDEAVSIPNPMQFRRPCWNGGGSRDDVYQHH